jgi:type II secretory pathway pseudopilin PulG
MTRPARTATATPNRPLGRAGAAAGGVRTAPAAPPRTGPVHGRPQLRLVPAAPVPSRARRVASAGRRAPFVLLVVLMLVGTTVSLLLLNTAIAVDSLEATQRRAAIADQAQQVDRLEQQVVTGSTATELARAAAANGLVPSGAAAHLVLGPDGTSAVRGTAEPAPPAGAPAAAPPAAAVPPRTEPAEAAPVEPAPAEAPVPETASPEAATPEVPAVDPATPATPLGD